MMGNIAMLWSKIGEISNNLIDNSNRRLWIPAIALFVLGVATRLPFQTQIASGDQSNFALAVEHFDLRLNQPQMPGMFVIFIFLGRFFNLFLDDPTASLVMVNVVASGIAAAMLYVMGTNWYNARVGWTVALLMLTSPFLWYYGETAFSHMAEFCWVVLIDYAAYLTGLGNRKALFVLALLMGVGGGIRPSTPFFLLPLSLVAVFLGLRTRKFNLVHLAAAVLVGLAGIAVWMIPLVMMSGGPQAYWDLLQGWLPLHAERQDADSLVKVFDNIMLLLKAFLRVVGLAIVPMLWFLIRDRAALSHSLRRDWRIQTLFLSIVPGLMYFIFVHLRRKSQTLTVMPAVIVMAGLTVVWLGDRFQKHNRHAWVLLTTAIVSLNGLFFLVGPEGLPTARDIGNFNTELTERIEFVQENFPAETTAILTRDYYSRIVSLYLRDYQEPRLADRLGDDPILVSPHVRTLVLLDDKVFNQPGQDAGFQKLVMPSGNTIRYRTWLAEQRLQLTKTSTRATTVN